MSDSSTASIPFRFSATGGAITSGGNYTAGTTAGSFRVVVTDTSGAFADTSSVTITAPATLARVVLSPPSASVAAGASQVFSATDSMSDGTTKSFGGTYTATGGTVSAAGLYTAGLSAGTYKVVAVEGARADTAIVTVTSTPPPPPPPPQVGTASKAELPRVMPVTVTPGPTRVVAVPCRSNLQTAINAAVPGDELRLAHGCTYVGNRTLPQKSGTAWVTITSDGVLPTGRVRRAMRRNWRSSRPPAAGRSSRRWRTRRSPSTGSRGWNSPGRPPARQAATS